MSKKTSHGPVQLVLLFIPVFFLAKKGYIVDNGGLRYCSLFISLNTIPFCEQFYHMMYWGCISLCVSPLPAWLQRRFQKVFWVGKSKLGHKFVILYEFPYWSCWLVLFSVFLLLDFAEPKSFLLLYLGKKKCDMALEKVSEYLWESQNLTVALT